MLLRVGGSRRETALNDFAGLFTRINDALLVGVLGVAVLQNPLVGRDAQLAILSALIVLALASMGGGRFSLDARRKNRHGQTTDKKI